MAEKNEKREIELRLRTPEERLQTAELRVAVLMQTVEALQKRMELVELRTVRVARLDTAVRAILAFSKDPDLKQAYFAFLNT